MAAFEWLGELGRSPLSFAPLAGDVSPRRYARVTFEGEPSSAVVAHYPREIRDSLGRFERTAGLLEDAGVRGPRIHAADADRGLMLLEDLGQLSLWDLRERGWPALELFLRRARSMIDRIQALSPTAVASLNPPLDAAALRAELEQTLEVFLDPFCLCGPQSSRRLVTDLFDELCRCLGEASPRPAHRDLMARNLMVLGEEPPEVGVLDHQDLRLAPPGYDAASLLNDSLYPPPAIVESLLGDVDREAYHRAAAQRTLKIVGTFVRFARRGATRYLPLVRPSLERSLEHLARLPEAQGAVTEIESLWRPAIGDLSDRLLSAFGPERPLETKP